MAKDPTKTLTIRRRSAAQIQRRFKRVKKRVNDYMSSSTNLITTNEGQDFTFVRDASKLTQFAIWFETVLDEEILRIGNGIEKKDHWLNVSIGESYIRGALKTRSGVQRLVKKLNKVENYNPLLNSAHVERSELIFERAFENLAGVTKTTADQVRRVLAEGILQGKNPTVVAREMADRVEKIGITRAKLISRTEIVESHNTASITEAKILSDETGQDIQMKWLTALDERVRSSHAPRHNQIYDFDTAQALIGEPNCRCSITAHVDLDELLKEEPKQVDVVGESLSSLEGKEIDLIDRSDFGKTYTKLSVDGKEIENVSRETVFGRLNDVTEEQKSAFKGYTIDDYYEINRHLREVEILEDVQWEPFKKQSDVISSALQGSSPTEQDGLLYRNLRRVGKQYEEGEVIIDTGFGSFTKSPETYSLAPSPDITVYKTTVIVQKGSTGLADIANVSNAPNEAEVLFDKNSKFRVHKIIELDKSTKELILEYIP